MNLLWIVLVTIISSGFILVKFSGYPLLINYLVFIVFYYTKLKSICNLIKNNLSQKQALILALITLIVIVLIVPYFLYPIANLGFKGGKGSDADEGVVTAVKALINFKYPYYTKSCLGNPVGPLPGSLILSIPFVLLGSMALQNIFWLTILFLCLKRILGDWRYSLLFIWTLMFTSPESLHELIVSGYKLSSTIIVLVFLILLIDYLSRNNISYWKKYLSAIFLGIALSSRGDLILILPVFFSFLIQNLGLKKSIKYLLIVLMAFVTVTLPFYLYDPFGFTPLQVQSGKILYLDPVLNLIKVILIITACLLISMQKIKNNKIKFLEGCAIILLIAPLLAIATSCIEFGRLDFSDLSYSFSSYVFILLAYFLRVIEKIK